MRRNLCNVVIRIDIIVPLRNGLLAWLLQFSPVHSQNIFIIISSVPGSINPSTQLFVPWFCYSQRDIHINFNYRFFSYHHHFVSSCVMKSLEHHVHSNARALWTTTEFHRYHLLKLPVFIGIGKSLYKTVTNRWERPPYAVCNFAMPNASGKWTSSNSR